MALAYLTEIRLNTRAREVRADLKNGGRGFHHRTARLAPPETATADARLLWRLDTFRNGLRLLVQTPQEPDLSTLPDTYGTARTHPLDRHLERLTQGQRVRYRLAANPVRTGTDEITGMPLKNRIPCKGEEITRWFNHRTETLGLAPETLATYQLAPVTGTRDHKPGLRLTLTRYDGIATITDPAALRTAILTGIGRGRAFGAGLLTVAAIA
ncbi:type I-E CRISPR-associated protein Cas6/Cse3/CasE [Actinacidiphila sp. DG2A-62]|uniref:type I-E CRISPR-associated protein Cas6/Cse3/CasE n=1 Tax=Actinacidiphila sp. DG2A-62 TaxID=3108821 RepID=UPI002DBA00AF|nr:type I-E CRISPR-associated protein Cas6/Cse3/CasE [Actinacidiphila sp. DG2A-62]MEC3996152.1 type I-E CRISPR-associated protein Cas6/Cse3/CasE [Actinacidiphila sp. DG2A-62]